MKLQFTTKNVAMPPLNFALVEQWLAAVAQNHGCQLGPVNYQFCDDDEILSVNRQFLGHDYYTDIITFDDTRRHTLRGDIVLSLDTVASNALAQGEPYNRELLRVIVHGILHLCGIDDKGPGQRAIMQQHEDQALSIAPQGIIK